MWLAVPEISEKYYSYPIPDNTMIIVKETEHTKGDDWWKRDERGGYYVTTEYYLLEGDWKRFADCKKSMTLSVLVADMPDTHRFRPVNGIYDHYVTLHSLPHLECVQNILPSIATPSQIQQIQETLAAPYKELIQSYSSIMSSSVAFQLSQLSESLNSAIHDNVRAGLYSTLSESLKNAFPYHELQQQILNLTPA